WTLEPPQWRGGPRVMRVTRGSLPGLSMFTFGKQKLKDHNLSTT
ncbi:unnamed protein product, partial [Penicillium salamii]